MIQDFATSTGNTVIETDICIVGAGAAGITVARNLLHSGRNIVLLESGGKDYEPPMHELAQGECVGFPYYPLEESRLRFFGGTTAVWGGRSAQLDEMDFRRRSWVDHSGWPFEKDRLRSYYRNAQESLDLSPVDDNVLPGFDSPLQQVRPAFWQFDEKFDRFTFNSSGDLTSSPHVRVVLHATAVGLKPSDNGRTIESLQISNLDGVRGEIRAKVFLLATGGLEIPRLLLVSRHPAHPEGVGNNHGLVGRFFMEHPHARGARIFPKDPRRLFDLLPRFARHRGGRYGMLLHPSEELQEKEGILNSCFTIAVRKHPGEHQVFYKSVYNKLRHDLSPTRAGRAAWKTTRVASIQTQDRLGPFLNRRNLARKGNGLYAVIRAEQAPNPNSRVRLSDDCDSLGVPRIALDWQMSSIDKHSVDRLMSAFDEELRRFDLGSAEPARWLSDDSKDWEVDPLVSNHAIGGYHHMGTTRMSTTPNDGVVDENCRVHGVENLYITGSAVFPTVGWANPTLTILALAIRLADRIKKEDRALARSDPEDSLRPHRQETPAPVPLDSNSRDCPHASRGMARVVKTARSPRTEPVPVPRTWVLLDERPGNSTQSLGLAQTLGWPYETYNLSFGRLSQIHNSLLGASLLGVDKQGSDAFGPPWPDLVIAAGGRTAPVSRWIRAQSLGRTRTVHLGRRGGARAASFDLVVTPGNARLWPHPRRMVTLLPTNRIDHESLQRAALRWRHCFDDEPAPRIAVLVGGATALFEFGPEEARRLGEQVATLARDSGGSVFVSTSRRTGEAATRELAKALPDAALFHEWSSNADENPYLGLLALADWIVVTGDSESMLAEACSTSKPVSIHALPPIGRDTRRRRIGEALVAQAMRCRPSDSDGPQRLPWTLAGACAWSIASGWILPPRDLDGLRENLIASGRAHSLGEKPDAMEVEPLREVEQVAERVRALFVDR